jgi:hypothetical protein
MAIMNQTFHAGAVLLAAADASCFPIPERAMSVVHL